MKDEELIVKLLLFAPRVLKVTKNVLGICASIAITLVAMAFEETVEKAVIGKNE